MDTVSKLLDNLSFGWEQLVSWLPAGASKHFESRPFVVVSGLALFLGGRLLWNSLTFYFTYGRDHPNNYNYAKNRRRALNDVVAPKARATVRLAADVHPSDSTLTDGYQPTADGTLLYYRMCAANPKKKNYRNTMLCVASGFQSTLEHSAYRIAVTMASRGFDVFQFDPRGHGRSDGLYSCVESFEEMVADTKLMFRFAKKRWGHKEMDYFMVGTSMGGAVCLLLSMAEDYAAIGCEDEIIRWNGLILNAPMVKVDVNRLPPQWLLDVMEYTLVPLLPRLSLVPNQDLMDFAVREDVEREWLTLSEVRYLDNMRPITGYSLLKAAEKLETCLERVTLPFLCLHGDADTLVSPKLSEFLLEHSSSKDKTLKMYPGGMHMNFDDLHRDEVFADIIQWMDKRRGHEVFRKSASQLLSFEQKVSVSKGDLEDA